MLDLHHVRGLCSQSSVRVAAKYYLPLVRKISSKAKLPFAFADRDLYHKTLYTCNLFRIVKFNPSLIFAGKARD